MLTSKLCSPDPTYSVSRFSNLQHNCLGGGNSAHVRHLWDTTFLLTVCPEGRFGPECRGQCTCGHNFICHHVTGECVCKPGHKGKHCSRGKRMEWLVFILILLYKKKKLTDLSLVTKQTWHLSGKVLFSKPNCSLEG